MQAQKQLFILPVGNEIYNGLLAPPEGLYSKMLCYVMRYKDEVFSLALEHGPELQRLEELLIFSRDIKDMIVGNRCLDVGLLHVWCT